MPVLENVSGRLRTYMLAGAHLATHPTHPNRYKSVRRVTVHQSKAGGLSSRTTPLVLPDSLRLVAGEQREVEPEVLHCPDVKAAIARGELRVAAVETTKVEEDEREDTLPPPRRGFETK
jgi:hypothetical protein